MSEIEDLPLSHLCECCGVYFRDMPPGCRMTIIGGWHRVRVKLGDDPNYELGAGNDPDAAVVESWKRWRQLGECRTKSKEQLTLTARVKESHDETCERMLKEAAHDQQGGIIPAHESGVKRCDRCGTWIRRYDKHHKLYCDACEQPVLIPIYGGSLALVNPGNMNCCFEAAEVLARTNGEDVRAQFSADPGVFHCCVCDEYLMREGEVVLCRCGAITHVPTGNEMTWHQVWTVNHRPPKERPKPKLPQDVVRRILAAMDPGSVWKRATDGIDLETALLMELDIARCIVESEMKDPALANWLRLVDPPEPEPKITHSDGSGPDEASDYEVG